MASPTTKLVAVITGASSGIGAAVALALASKGYEVVGLARRVDRITELNKKTKDGNIHAKSCDMSVKEQIVEAFKWVNDTFGGVDVLVNNAGLGTLAKISEGKYEDWKNMFDVNVLAVGLCTQEALKTMKKRGDNGVIINISSIAGVHIPRVYDIPMYSASKHAVSALSYSTSNELMRENSKIRVTNISPGTVYTEMMGREMARIQGIPFDPSIMEGPLPEQSLDPKDIADAVLYILGTPPRVQISELTIQPIGQPFI